MFLNGLQIIMHEKAQEITFNKRGSNAKFLYRKLSEFSLKSYQFIYEHSQSYYVSLYLKLTNFNFFCFQVTLAEILPKRKIRNAYPSVEKIIFCLIKPKRGLSINFDSIFCEQYTRSVKLRSYRKSLNIKLVKQEA